MRTFSKFISYVFHPMWMPLYVVLIFWYLDNRFYSNMWLYVVFVVFLNTILIPFLMIWMMQRLKIIHNINLHNHSDRFYSLSIVGLLYLVCWYIFYQLDIFDLITQFLLIAPILVLLAILINFFWKISIHSIAMGAMSVFIVYLSSINLLVSNWPSYLVIFLSGLVGFSRIYLNQHKPLQVYLGYLSGSFVTAAFLFGLLR